MVDYTWELSWYWASWYVSTPSFSWGIASTGSALYPWLSETEIKRLIEYSKTLWATNQQELTKKQHEVYQQMIAAKTQQKKAEQEMWAMNDLTYKANNGDQNAAVTLRVRKLREYIEKTTWTTYQENDQQMFDKIMSSNPDLQQPFLNYLNKWDGNIFQLMGLKTPTKNGQAWVLWTEDMANIRKRSDLQALNRMSNEEIQTAFTDYVNKAGWIDKVKDIEAMVQDINRQHLSLWKDYMMWDFAAAPTAVVWAVASIPRTVANVVKLIDQQAGDNMNAKLNSYLDSMWIDRDSFFEKAGEFVGQAGQQMLAAWAIGSATGLTQLLTKAPMLVRLLAGWVGWAVGTETSSIISKWENATLGEMAIWFGIWTLAQWVSEIVWSLKKSIVDAPPLQKKAVENMTIDQIDDIAKKTEELKNVPGAPNPVLDIKSQVDDLVTQIKDDRSGIWQMLWNIRTSMQWTKYSTDAVINNFNQMLKGKWIASQIVKTVKKSWEIIYKISTKMPKTSWENVILNDIVGKLNGLQSLWRLDTLQWLDDLTQQIIAGANKAEDKAFKAALWEASSFFSKEVSSNVATPALYGQAKMDYSQLSKLKELFEEITTAKWDAGIKILSKLGDPTYRNDIQVLLSELYKNGYIKDDILGRIITTKYIMDSKLGKDAFTKAMQTYYPSIPGTYDLGIQRLKSKIISPVMQLKQAVPGAEWLLPMSMKKAATQSVAGMTPNLLYRWATEVQSNE